MRRLFEYAVVILLLAGTLMALAGPTHATFAAEDQATVRAQAVEIAQDAQTLQQQAQQIEEWGLQIQAQESDQRVLDDAKQMVELARQVEQDSGSVGEMADEINYRIDHSEGTTLQLSQDIGTMADRILWTEGQIGVMANRIVDSEHLITETSRAMAQDTLALSGQMQATTNHIADLADQMSSR